MKLDDALIQTGKLCFWGKVEAARRCFSWLLTEGVQLKRDHWLPESSAKVRSLKFQIGIAPFSLCLSCQILVHRLDWKELRLGLNRGRGGAGVGRRSVQPLCPAALSSVWIFFWVCLGLRFWPVVPSIVSRENFTLEFSVFYRWGVWVQTVSSNNCKGKTSPLLHEWTDSFEISSIKLNLHWILQVSDPPNKFRGIKIRFFFCFVCFFIKLWEPKEIPLASYCWPSCSRRPRARAHPWGQTSTYLWCYLVAVMWYQ